MNTKFGTAPRKENRKKKAIHKILFMHESYLPEYLRESILWMQLKKYLTRVFHSNWMTCHIISPLQECYEVGIASPVFSVVLKPPTYTFPIYTLTGEQVFRFKLPRWLLFINQLNYNKRFKNFFQKMSAISHIKNYVLLVILGILFQTGMYFKKVTWWFLYTETIYTFMSEL